jgi:hypothetical protein
VIEESLLKTDQLCGVYIYRLSSKRLDLNIFVVLNHPEDDKIIFQLSK